MSHYTVLVVLQGEDDLKDELRKKMAPYSEEREVPRYIRLTKQEAIEKARKDIEDYKNSTYAEYLKDPEKYKSEYGGNPGHIKYLEEEFPPKLNYTDDELYAEATKWYQDDLDENGNITSTSNPHGYWDWYQVGGRWIDILKLKPGTKGMRGNASWMFSETERKDGYADAAVKKDIDFEGMKNEDGSPFHTFAILYNGVWTQRGLMGWWGNVQGEQPTEEWAAEFTKILNKIPDDMTLVVVDCHI